MATKRKAPEQASIPLGNKRVRANDSAPEPSGDEDMLRKKGASRVRARRRWMAPSPSSSPSRRSPQPSVLGADGPTAEYENQDEEEVSSIVVGETDVRTPSPNEGSSEDENHGADDDDQLLTCIRTGIAYTRAQHTKSRPVMQTTRFEIRLPTDDYVPTPSQAAALVLLSAAYKSGHATLIRNSPVIRVYELGVPVPYLVAEGANVVPIHLPHWWVGKSAAEIKAGPHAEERYVRRAAAHLKGQATKRKKAEKDGKTKREREIEDKLEEGVRRQEAGLKMWDLETDSNEDLVLDSSTNSEDSSGSGSEGGNKQLSDILEEEENEVNRSEQEGAKETVVQGHFEDSDSDRPLLPRMVIRIPRAGKEVHYQPAAATETTVGSDKATFLQPRVIRRSPRHRKMAQSRQLVDDSDSDAPLVPRRRSQRKR
jgi:hypothetical protein